MNYCYNEPCGRARIGWLTGFIAIFCGAVAVVKGDNWGYAGIVGIILGAIGVYGGLFGF